MIYINYTIYPVYSVPLIVSNTDKAKIIDQPIS